MKRLFLLGLLWTSVASAQEAFTLEITQQVPALREGQKIVLPIKHTLTIAPERMVWLRHKAEVTPTLLAEVKQFLQALQKPTDAQFEEHADGWLVVQRNALQINQDEVIQALTEALGNPERHLLSLEGESGTAPARTLDFYKKNNITHFLGSGQTNYVGSSPNRIKNIRVGASFFKDRLFTGKQFSFNKAIGTISRQKGYVSGTIIAGDRTEQGLGGGICQVSTTVFRAMYGAGFDILERHSHSYKVYYYEPHGLDAAIYQPSMDLRFALPGNVWTQLDWNEKDQTITILLFGAKPRYEVKITDPVTLKTILSLPDRLLYDPKLPKGTRKQVDWAAEGGTVRVTRIFMQDNQEIKRDSLTSRYRPWSNAFRIGTGRQ